MRIPFAKMHGAGNDLVIVSCLDGDPAEDLEAFARFALDRRLGVGGDQLLLVQPSERADFFMGIRNPDGSTAEMCANGIRAFFKYVRDRGLAGGNQIRVETLAGVVTPRWLGGDQIEVEMLRPILAPEKIPTLLRPAHGDGPVLELPLDVAGQKLRVTAVSMGNPHCVIFVDDPETFPVETVGSEIERNPAFPERTNVEFVAVRGPDRIVQRTWERGTGETLACGSGACAVAVVSMLRGIAEREVSIELRGGELRISWADEEASVWMTGPAEEVFTGRIPV